MSSPIASPTASTANSGPGQQPVAFGFENTYARLPPQFYARLNPTPVAAPRLIKLNADLARKLGLDPQALASSQGVEILAGNRVAAGSEPLAIAYAGHQFGHFVPQLGDGRANLLGEVTGIDGVRYDVQLKGSGPTPFSRRGDGRAALGPVLREYIVSEAMAAMGVRTTRALAAVLTGDRVLRETVLPGAVLTRIAASHLRVGTFQYFAAREDAEGLRRLADYAIERHYPEVAQSQQPYRSFLDGVIGRQARLIARWMLLGFVHGVMNTDNMSISGETIDYGPCAFMEAYDPNMVFSSIDRNGRYAYSNQPAAAHWNLTRLAEALLPLLETEQGSQEAALTSAWDALSAFVPQYEAARNTGFCRKIGLFEEQQGDAPLADDLLNRMATNQADFTLTFRRLCDEVEGPQKDRGVRQLFTDPNAFDSWAALWRQRLQAEPMPARADAMRLENPAFIPRNHIVQAALEAANTQGDFQPFEDILDVVSQPYEDRPNLERYATPALPEECVRETFCGT
ncbi:MAG: protein adenylyltransferase SelO [Janthinobacterium lividum]